MRLPVLLTLITTGALARHLEAIRRMADEGLGKSLARAATREASARRFFSRNTTKRHDCWLWAEGAWLAASRMILIRLSSTGRSWNWRMLCRREIVSMVSLIVGLCI